MQNKKKNYRGTDGFLTRGHESNKHYSDPHINPDIEYEPRPVPVKQCTHEDHKCYWCGKCQSSRIRKLPGVNKTKKSKVGQGGKKPPSTHLQLYNFTKVQSVKLGNGESREYIVWKNPIRHSKINDPLDNRELIKRENRVRAQSRPGNHCHECGKPVRKSKNMKRVPKYCRECLPVIKKRNRKRSDSKRMQIRGTVGTVPVYNHLFVKYMGRVLSILHGASWKRYKLFLSIPQIEHACVERGVEAPREFQYDCLECGGSLVMRNWHVYHYGVQGKIGAKVVACKDCGLVYEDRGLKSYASRGNNDYAGVA